MGTTARRHRTQAIHGTTPWDGLPTVDAAAARTASPPFEFYVAFCTIKPAFQQKATLTDHLDVAEVRASTISVNTRPTGSFGASWRQQS